MAEEQVNEQNLGEDEYYEHFRIVADPKQSAIRIDKFLMDRVENTSRNRLQNAIRSGSVLVDDQPIKPNYKIRPGNTVTIVLPREPTSEEDERYIIAEDIPLDIRYEDEDLLVLYKPPGMVVHPGVGNRMGTLVNALAFHYGQQRGHVETGDLVDRPALVHRIDKDTSGLMVVPKSDYAKQHLAKQFFQHTIFRRYQALVWGEPESEEGTIIGNLGRDPSNRLRFRVFPDGEEGKYAVTHFKVLERLYYVSLVECRLETGRTHQIRVHMRYLGHTLFNDHRYDGDQILKGTVYNKYQQFVYNCFRVCPRQALHAKSLGFIHPATGEEMYFDSELPDDMQLCLNRWRQYLASRKEALE